MTLFFEDVPLVEFTYLVFTRMPGESYCRWLRSLLLCLCDVFQALNNSLVCWSYSYHSKPILTVYTCVNYMTLTQCCNQTCNAHKSSPRIIFFMLKTNSVFHKPSRSVHLLLFWKSVHPVVLVVMLTLCLPLSSTIPLAQYILQNIYIYISIERERERRERERTLLCCK